jgi:hypothetical protein
LKCRNCGDPVDPERVELGYDYCLKDECQRRCLSPVLLASIGVNKAADYYTTAEELLPPPLPRSAGPVTEPEEPEPVASPRRRATPKTAKSTLAKLRDQEAALDAALEACYQRFCRAEITAKELDRERDDLVRRFNQAVSAENIRYRGMLRKRPARTR